MTSAEIVSIYQEVKDYIFEKYGKHEVMAWDTHDAIPLESLVIDTPFDYTLKLSWVAHADQIPVLKLTVSKELVDHILEPIEADEKIASLKFAVKNRKVHLTASTDGEYVWLHWHLSNFRNAGLSPKKVLFALIDEILIDKNLLE